MKVIDIMQKVANKEIFKFRIDNVNYYVDKSNYICEEDGNIAEWVIDDEWLNMNAKVIEEDKKIEKLNVERTAQRQDRCDEITIDYLKADIITIMYKINEIIDYINGGTNGE